MRKNYLILVCVIANLFFVTLSFAQVGSVNLTPAGGSAVSYPSITAAYAAIPSGTAVNYLIEILPAYNGTAETYPIAFSDKGLVTGGATITIRPAAGNKTCVIQRVTPIAGAVTQFTGGDNVIFDGRPGGVTTTQTDYLTINDPFQGSSSSRIIEFATSSSNNNTIQYINCIAADPTAAGGARTILIGGVTGGNKNNIIQYCVVSGGQRVIQDQGADNAANANVGTIIRYNTVKNFTSIGINETSGEYNCTVQGNTVILQNFAAAGTALGITGINITSATAGSTNNVTDNIISMSVTPASSVSSMVAIQDNGSGTENILRNTVTSLSSAICTSFTGINIGAGLLTTFNISSNNVSGMVSTLGASVRGVVCAPITGSTINVNNNFVSITDANSAATSMAGIQLNNVTGGYNSNIYYNSVHIGGAQATTNNTLAYGIYRAETTATSNYNQLNNIVLNERTGGGSTAKFFGFNLASTNGTLNINYNTYYSTDTNNGYAAGWTTSSYKNNALATYKSGTGTQEQLSNFKSVTFVSNTDLHLSGSSIGDLALVGTPIAGITTDFDGTNRSSTSPVQGANETTDPGLKNIGLSAGTLSPVFSSQVLTYTVSVSNITTSISVSPTAFDARLPIKVNGVSVASGATSSSIPLTVGNNTITVTTTSLDGVANRTYTVNVSRAPSTVATLNNITLSSGTLTPSFTAATTSYTATVLNTVTTITLTPVYTDATSTIQVNGVTVASGAPSAPINLIVGSNTINTVVTAQDGVTTKTYTIVITRPPSAVATLSNLVPSTGTINPVFSPTVLAYSVNVPNLTTSITVTPQTTDATATVTVNGVVVTSGSASASIPLAVGSNAITTIVTAQDGTTKQTYTLTANRSAAGLSINAKLSSLTISQGTLTPAFASTTSTYSASVANTITTLTVTPTLSDATASIKVNNVAVNSGSASGSIPLTVGNNTINVVVTAQDNATTQTYTITVNRALSAVATLSNLIISPATLTPAFSAATTAYTASVANNIRNLTLTPVPTDPTATIQINGTTVASGSSIVVPLISGNNTINTVVTAQDGTTIKTYSLVIFRAFSSISTLDNLAVGTGTLSPAFSQSSANYSVNVTNLANVILITPTATIQDATVRINGTVVPYATGGTVPLNVGTNVVSVLVTAQDSTTKQTYTITVTRAQSSVSTLNNLILSSGALTTPFATGTNNYTANVPNLPSSITVTPVTTNNAATLTVNGVPVTNGSASQSIPLSVGNTTITVIVTSQDNTTTQTYTVVVTRPPSSDATLSNLELSAGSLNPLFSPGTLSYTLNVPNSITGITVKPTTNEANALVLINGKSVASGSQSSTIPLIVGTNVITTLITAQDGISTQTYTISIIRAPSSIATLADLTINAGALSPVFSTASGVSTYNITVNNRTDTVLVTPNASDITSTILVNGALVLSGTASGKLIMHTGSNTINIVVTAQDGVTQVTYQIIVYKTIAEGSIHIANLLTPNGDGKNDKLLVKDIFVYPNNTVTVFNRVGKVVFSKHGYQNDWDGTMDGNPLPEGTYYYNIDLGPGHSTLKGFITIVKTR